MKKSMLALAVAAALAAPLAAQADTILYGSARVSVDYNDEKVPGFILDQNGRIVGFDTEKQSSWDVFNNDSRLGVLGSEDLGSGLSAVYQYEFGVDVTEGGNFDETKRPKFVGLKGGFGSLTVGTQETPYYHVAGVTDIFNSGRTFTNVSWLGGSYDGTYFSFGAAGDARAQGLTRLDNSLYYTTPDFSGFTGEVLLVMNGGKRSTSGAEAGRLVVDNNPSDGIDLWNIAAKYSNGPFFAGASYIKLEGGSDYADTFANPPINRAFDFDLDQWTVGLGYSSGPFNIGFTYEQGTLNQFGLISNMSFNGIRWGGDDATNYYLAGSYTFGNNVISAAYGQLDPGTDGFSTIDNYVLGYQYNLSKRTRLWVEYIGRNADPSVTGLPVAAGRRVVFHDPYGDANAVSIGTRVDF